MSKEKYLYQDQTEKLIGFAFDIFRQIGPRHPEKVYQKAYENKLVDHDINHKREVYQKIEVDGKRVGTYFFDFF